VFLHYDAPQMYSPTLALLDNCLKSADARSCFEGYSVEEYFMAYRADERIDDYLSAFETEIGVSFESNFSFAFVSGLLKGLTDAKTKNSSIGLISTISNIGSHQFRPENLGYLAALLPFQYVEKINTCEERLQFFWTRELIPDSLSSFLLFSVWVGLLNQGKVVDAETRTIYLLLEEGMRFDSEGILGIPALLPLLREVIQLSKEAEMVGRVLGILEELSLTFKKKTEPKEAQSRWRFSLLTVRNVNDFINVII
jgi:hypothetical protein